MEKKNKRELFLGSGWGEFLDKLELGCPHSGQPEIIC